MLCQASVCCHRKVAAIRVCHVEQQDIPQIPYTQLAIITCRDNFVLLLMCEVNVSDRHQVSVRKLANALHAANVPDLQHMWSSLAIAELW